MDPGDAACRLTPLPPAAMGDPAPTPPPRSMAKVLGTCRLPDNFIGDLSDWFRVTDADGGVLLTEQRKGGATHAFLGRLATEAAPALSLAHLALLTVNWDGETHVLHSLFSVPVRPYNPDRRLFGCCGELPSEGLPAITDIPVAPFAVRCIVNAVPWGYHIVHVEGVSTPSWRSTPCERASGKAEGQNLT